MTKEEHCGPSKRERPAVTLSAALATRSTRHHASPEWHLTAAAAAGTQPPLSYTLLKDMSSSPTSSSSSSPLTHRHTRPAQPWRTRTDLLPTPRSASSSPPGCSSGSEAKMCRMCVCVCVGVRACVCVSAEGMNHIFMERLEATAMFFINVSKCKKNCPQIRR